VFRFFVVVLFFSLRCFASQPIALIYNGPGACPENCAKSAARAARAAGFHARIITPSQLTAAALNDASVYVQPGGVSGTVASTLTPEQKQMLRDFVSRGGGYVGFCAGANFAALNIRDASTGGYLSQVDLGLIPMTAHLYDGVDDASILSLTWDGKARQIYWEGGPYFETPLAPGVDVFATYPNGQMAGVRAHYGRGRVSVTGTHPEAPQSWRDYYKLNDADGVDVDLAQAMIRWAGHSTP
jgi:glutamine amidotransferase-like uncharacterized protein